MFEFEWPENLSIFFDNLCVYHIFFDLLSFFMIIFTWWYCGTSYNSETDNKQLISELNEDEVAKKIDEEEDEEEENVRNEQVEGKNSVMDWCDDAIMSNVKFIRQKALVKELKSKLTQDELEEERKTEKMQLQKIFQLLQEQEDKFQMSSMEQLEDQLHLYIN